MEKSILVLVFLFFFIFSAGNVLAEVVSSSSEVSFSIDPGEDNQILFISFWLIIFLAVVWIVFLNRKRFLFKKRKKK